MNKITLPVLGVIVVVAGIVASSALFTVDQRSQAVVMQFGEPIRVIRTPGLNVKVPFVQNVVYYDKRVLDLDPPVEQVILADQKRINVDAFARYRITDPLRFFQAVRTEPIFRDRYGKILNASVRTILGLQSLPELLSEKRDDIMATIKGSVSEAAKNFGIKIVDVRIGRTDLPEDISKNVYDRMRSEREREANLLRAEGDELKQKITADADRQKTIILAEATKQADILRGEGDAAKTRILGKAHEQGRDFFDFTRSLEAMRKGLDPKDTSLVLAPDSNFFRFFADPSGAPLRTRKAK